MKKIGIVFLLCLAFLLWPVSILRADAAYQITLSANTDYAVFTLTFAGSVSGLQITSPVGIVFNQGNSGAAYKVTDGKIQIGVRYAESGKWKISVLGSPDDGFQILITSNASYGDFAGYAPVVTPTISPVPTSMPTPTLAPTPTQSPPSPTEPMPNPTATPTMEAETPITESSIPIVMHTSTPTPTTTPVIEKITPTPTTQPTATPVVIINAGVESTKTPTTISADLQKIPKETVKAVKLFSWQKKDQQIALIFLCMILTLLSLRFLVKKRHLIRAKHFESVIARAEKIQSDKDRLQTAAYQAAERKALRQKQAAQAQLLTLQLKEEAAEAKAIIKAQKRDLEEAERFYAVQAKAESQALSVLRKRQEKEKNARLAKIKHAQKEDEKIQRTHLKEAAAAGKVRRKQEKAKDYVRRKEMKQKEAVAATVLLQRKKSAASMERLRSIQVHAEEKAKNIQRQNEIRKERIHLSELHEKKEEEARRQRQQAKDASHAAKHFLREEKTVAKALKKDRQKRLATGKKEAKKQSALMERSKARASKRQDLDRFLRVMKRVRIPTRKNIECRSPQEIEIRKLFESQLEKERLEAEKKDLQALALRERGNA